MWGNIRNRREDKGWKMSCIVRIFKKVHHMFVILVEEIGDL